MSNIPGSPNTTPGEFNQATYINSNGAINVSNPIPGAFTGNSAGSNSNSAGYIPDFLTIIQEASEMAGVDFTTSYSLRSAKRSLDFLFMEMANMGLNLWTLQFENIVLTPGNPGPYQLPQDTIDIVAPSIRQFVAPGPLYTVGGVNGNPPAVQTVDQANAIDIVMTRQDFASYLSIPDKAAQGRPIVLYTQRLQPNPQVYVWLSPESYTGATIWTLVYFKLRRIQNTGNATNLPDLPFRFIPMLTKGLAHQLSLKAPQKNFNLIQLLKMEYNESKLMAQREDRDRSSVYISPGGYDDMAGGWGN